MVVSGYHNQATVQIILFISAEQSIPKGVSEVAHCVWLHFKSLPFSGIYLSMRAVVTVPRVQMLLHGFTIRNWSARWYIVLWKLDMVGRDQLHLYLDVQKIDTYRVVYWCMKII